MSGMLELEKKENHAQFSLKFKPQLKNTNLWPSAGSFNSETYTHFQAI
jgi:hypothetical protein